MSNIHRKIGKLFNTLKIVIILALARTFGHYHRSGWNGYYHYAVYTWRDKTWVFPTTSMKDGEP